jgi:hypothetical protein
MAGSMYLLYAAMHSREYICTITKSMHHQSHYPLVEWHAVLQRVSQILTFRGDVLLAV